MKATALLFLIITTSVAFAQEKGAQQGLSGSWINAKVALHYEFNGNADCNDMFYTDILPLYLSFKNKNQIEVTIRYEQPSSIYTIKASKTDTIVAYNGKSFLKLYFTSYGLEVIYNNSPIPFRKVAEGYSKQAFSEFVKSKFFNKYKQYRIDFFDGSNDFKKELFNRNNFEVNLRNLFKSEAVNIGELLSVKYKNECLPGIIVYDTDKAKKNYKSRVLAIKYQGTNLIFIDESGKTILILKPYNS